MQPLPLAKLISVPPKHITIALKLPTRSKRLVPSSPPCLREPALCCTTGTAAAYAKPVRSLSIVVVSVHACSVFQLVHKLHNFFQTSCLCCQTKGAQNWPTCAPRQLWKFKSQPCAGLPAHVPQCAKAFCILALVRYVTSKPGMPPACVQDLQGGVSFSKCCHCDDSSVGPNRTRCLQHFNNFSTHCSTHLPVTFTNTHQKFVGSINTLLQPLSYILLNNRQFFAGDKIRFVTVAPQELTVAKHCIESSSKHASLWFANVW